MPSMALLFTPQARGKTLAEKMRAAFRAFRDRREQRLAARHLAQLDDHLLKDIGIGRSEINYMVYSLQTKGSCHHDGMAA